tara:strand:+ start:7435 stop:7539 length:105 start_codon:yes stop_codon:yes gene_type:complete
MPVLRIGAALLAFLPFPTVPKLRNPKGAPSQKSS